VISNPKWPRAVRTEDWGSFRMDDDMSSPTPSSLDVDEQVSLQDVLSLFVLLRGIVGFIIFPPKGDPALDTIYISYCVISSRHLAITRFAFDDIHPTRAYRVSLHVQVEGSTM